MPLPSRHLLLLLSLPVFWKLFDYRLLPSFLILLLLWEIFLTLQKKPLKWLIFSLYLISLSLSNLILDGVLTSQLAYQPNRTVSTSYHYSSIIHDFQLFPNPVPFRLRKILISDWVVAYVLFGRFLRYLWLDQFTIVYGIGSVAIFISSLFRKHPLQYWLPLLGILCVGVFSAVLAKDPNPAGFYLLMLPPVATYLFTLSSHIRRWPFILIIIANLISFL